MSQDEIIPGSSSLRAGAAQHLSRPTECSVDPKRKLVVVKFGKKLSMRDVERYAVLLRANPSFRPDFSEIVDLTEVEEVSLQGEEFLRLADRVDPFSYDAKRAFVARNSVQSHAARMHKILRTQRNIEIFRTVADAKRWIAL